MIIVHTSTSTEEEIEKSCSTQDNTKSHFKIAEIVIELNSKVGNERNGEIFGKGTRNHKWTKEVDMLNGVRQMTW